MSEYANRIEARLASWKARLTGGQRSHDVGTSDDREDSVAELQRATQQLEVDLADLLGAAALQAERAANFEARAMEAIRNGDDGAAREALRTQQECVDTLARLEADATVIRAMIAECRAVLGDGNAP